MFLLCKIISGIIIKIILNWMHVLSVCLPMQIRVIYGLEQMMPASSIGTDKADISGVSPSKGKPGPAYHNIHALLQDGDKLFVGMFMGGLDILDLRTGKFKIIRQILLRVHCILLKSMHFIKIPDRKYGLVLLPD